MIHRDDYTPAQLANIFALIDQSNQAIARVQAACDKADLFFEYRLGREEA